MRFTFLLLSFTIIELMAQVPELVVPIGHTRIIRTMDFSFDSRLLLTGSDDETIKLWDVEAGRELRTIRLHDERVRYVRFLKGDTTAFSFAWGSQLYLFDIRSGALIRSIEPGKSVREAVVDDGEICAVTSLTADSIYILNLADGTVKEQIDAGGVPEKLAISRDGTTVAWITAAGSLFQHDRTEDKTYTIADSLSAEPEALTLSGNGKYLSAGFGDGSVMLWDTYNETLLYSAKVHTSRVEHIVITENPFMLFTAGWDNKIRGIEIIPKRDFIVADNLGQFSSPALSRDGSRFAYSLSSGILNIYRDGKWQYVITTGSGVRGIKYDKLNNVLYSVDDYGIASWSFGRKDVMGRISRFDLTGALDIAPSGTHLLAGTYSRGVVEYVTGRPDSFFIYNGPEATVSDVGYSPDGSLITAVGADSILWQWNAEKEEAHVFVYAPRGYYESFAFSPDGKYLAAGNRDSTITLWHFDSVSTEKILPGQKLTSDIVFSSDSRMFATTSVDGSVKIWETATGGVITTLYDNDTYQRQLAWSGDKQHMAFGNLDRNLFLANVTSGETEELKGHESWIEGVAFMKGDSLLASGSMDGTVIIWDVYTKEKLVQLVPLDSADWVALMPDGRFDGSRTGIELMYLVKGTEIIPLQSYYDIYYTPGLIAGVFSGEIRPFEGSGKSIEEIKPSPMVEIVTGEKKKFKTGETAITAKVFDRGGGVSSVKLYHNGKLIEQRRAGAKAAEEYMFTVELLPDTNVISVVADNPDGMESAPAVTRIFAEGTKPASRLYILGIGINQYKNEKYNLTGAVNDVQKLSALLADRSKGVFAGIETRLITDKKAVKAELVKELNRLKKKIKPADVFILLYSGHGVVGGEGTGSEDFYFVLHDVVNMYGGANEMKKQGLSSSELKDFLAGIRANKQLVVIDACQAGGALESFALRGVQEEKAINSLARNSGVFLLASSAKNQLAKEVKALGMGIYSYALYEAINCLGDIDRDGVVNVREIEQYTRRRLFELTREYNLSPQYPVSWMVMQDFPVTVCRAEK
ncbi:MAG: caspase family protein [Ignavibacteriales bacterium]|nr:MAG: caspase family protein [Ignavibacteriales bacterium]